MKRLKVLFVTAWYPTQADPVSGVFVREHVKASSLCNDVVVLHSKTADAPIRGLCQLSRNIEDGVRVIGLSYRGSPVPKTTVLVQLYGLLRAVRELHAEGFIPDVIHAVVYTAGVSAVVLGKLYRIPVVLTEYSTRVLKRALKGSDVLKLKVAMGGATLVLPVSTSLEGAMKTYGKSPMKVVPCCVDAGRYRCCGVESIEGGHKRMLFIGYLIPRKGIPYLLRGLSILRAKRTDFCLDIVGDGPCRREYEGLTAQLDLEDFVSFRGAVEETEKIDLLRRCDFLVLPSSWENFGVVLIEAMACGKPVIATARGGPREIVTRDTGILAPPEDPVALAEAMEYVLDNYSDYSGETIARYARERYSREAVGRQLSDIYQQLVSYNCP